MGEQRSYTGDTGVFIIDFLTSLPGGKLLRGICGTDNLTLEIGVLTAARVAAADTKAQSNHT